MTVSLIVAASDDDVIGVDGDLPWHVPEDLKRFKSLTIGHAVVVGSTTQRSIERRLGRPLPGRRTVVLTRSSRPAETGDVTTAASVEDALRAAREHASAQGQDEVFVIGGASVYAQTLAVADRVYLTRVHTTVAGDTSMPAGWLTGFEVSASSGPLESASGARYSFLDYHRSPR